ncbi:MAG: hybrid sensor histidine kinase/response regulator [Pseudomonadota bacterium]
MLTERLPPVKFLLVDDREENLFALTEILRRDGLELVAARSGSAALELLLVHEFALAIIDVQMPEMDGVELAELMRGSERTQTVPIILVTAGTQERSRLFRGYEVGAVDFLYKPIEPVVLRNKAATFFELYRQRQQLARQLELLSALTQRLEETLRLNELFVAAIGHDLRNPLSAIIAGAQLIVKRSADSEAVRLARTMRDGGKRMQRMTGELFDLTRARLGGGIPIERAPLDLRPLVERVFDEHRLAAEGRELSLVIHGNVEGEWDCTRLEQVLSNLLGNAVQHGDRIAPVEVEIDGTQAEVVVMEVRNGGKVSASLLPKLFDPFRARMNGRESDGLGLGLFIVQQIAIAHGGRVEVESAEERGTAFRVQIPRHVPSSPAQQKAQ